MDWQQDGDTWSLELARIELRVFPSSEQHGTWCWNLHWSDGLIEGSEPDLESAKQSAKKEVRDLAHEFNAALKEMG